MKLTVEEEKKLMEKEEFPQHEMAKCPHCNSNDFKILWDSTHECHKVRSWGANLVCNKCHYRVDIGGRNW